MDGPQAADNCLGCYVFRRPCSKAGRAKQFHLSEAPEAGPAGPSLCLPPCLPLCPSLCRSFAGPRRGQSEGRTANQAGDPTETRPVGFVASSSSLKDSKKDRKSVV